ncbi:MAG: site-specific integrase [Arenibacter algicola]
MNQESVKILFFMNRSKENSKGVCPLYCRITYSGKRKQFSTGIFVDPGQWSAKKQLVIAEAPTARNLNGRLAIIRQKLQLAFLALDLEGTPFDVGDITAKYFGKKVRKEVTLVQYFRDYLARQSKLIGKDIKVSTWKKFEYVCNDVESFLWYKYKVKDMPIRKLKEQFLEDFQYYLKTEKEQKQVTINKEVQRLRKPVKTAVSEGYLDIDPFAQHKPGRVIKEVVFLTKEELEILEKHHFSQTRLQLVRDLFIFCCYTGLAYREMSDLKKVHIIKGFDGNDWIMMKREKTGKDIAVPLLPRAISIIEKYKAIGDHVLPKFSNQKINSYLKEIADIVGFEKSISHHTARKTFASTVLLYNNVPMEVVSELLGHSSIKITQEYYGKVVQKRVSAEMDKLNQKLSSRR